MPSTGPAKCGPAQGFCRGSVQPFTLLACNCSGLFLLVRLLHAYNILPSGLSTSIFIHTLHTLIYLLTPTPHKKKKKKMKSKNNQQNPKIKNTTHSTRTHTHITIWSCRCPWLSSEGQNVAHLWLFAFFALRVMYEHCDSTHVDEAKALSGWVGSGGTKKRKEPLALGTNKNGLVQNGAPLRYDIDYI